MSNYRKPSKALEGWTVLAEDLFGLLHRHRDTIKWIDFDDIHLQGGTWGQLLDGIRDESAVMWTQADCERLSDGAGVDYSATEGEVIAFLREERDNPLTDYWEQREEEQDDEDEGEPEDAYDFNSIDLMAVSDESDYYEQDE